MTTVLFSVLNAVVLRPLPYREPGRIEVLWEVAEDGKLLARLFPHVSRLAGAEPHL